LLELKAAMGLRCEVELSDASILRKYLGVLVASILTPAIAVFSFMMLSETVALLGLGQHQSGYPAFSLKFFWLTAQLMLLGYVGSFLLIPIAITCHFLTHSPLFARTYGVCVVLGIVVALVLGVSVFGDLVRSEFAYEQNIWILMLVIGGAFSGAANLALYRLISGDGESS